MTAPSGLLAALIVVVIGHGLAPVAVAQDAGLFGSAEYLLWWTKSGRIPPLVTQGGNGVIGSPGVRVFLDSLDFVDDPRHGGRFTVGYRFASNPRLAIEGIGFFLSDGQGSATFASLGDPVVAQPYVTAQTGRPAATLVSAPGIATGAVAVGARTGLWGAEANLTACLVCSGGFHVTALGGFRFLRLDDDLENTQQFRFAGSSVSLEDEFRTTNDFYGAQVGLKAGVRHGMLTVDVRGKVALGQMRQSANVNGATNVVNPNGSVTIFPGGLYALVTNIGRHERDRFAVVPEAGVDIGLQLTRNLRLYAGYTFLWISTVARAGGQIDPVINTTIFPILSERPLSGPARPAFDFGGTDFWAQGLNVGLQLQF